MTNAWRLDALGPTGTIERGLASSTKMLRPIAPMSGVNTGAPVMEDTISLFHQGTLRGGQVSTMRGLSTSLSKDLSHYLPNGQLYEFQIPRSTYNQWLDDGLAIPKTDYHLPSGITTPEIRVLPPASGSLNQSLIRTPGN